MEAFDYAIQMEKDGEAYYRNLAAKHSDRGIVEILSLLADDEVRHRKVLEMMKRFAAPEVSKSTIVSDAKNIFSQMTENDEDISVDVSQLELYKIAQDLERKSQKFYLDKAAEVSDTHQKEIFRLLADEEDQHHFILQIMIDAYSHPDPKFWLKKGGKFRWDKD